jgi:hypothetical protein
MELLVILHPAFVPEALRQILVLLLLLLNDSQLGRYLLLLFIII